MLLLIGAILTIIVFGFVLVWISFLMIDIAFFMMKPLPTEPPADATKDTPKSV